MLVHQRVGGKTHLSAGHFPTARPQAAIKKCEAALESARCRWNLGRRIDVGRRREGGAHPSRENLSNSTMGQWGKNQIVTRFRHQKITIQAPKWTIMDKQRHERPWFPVEKWVCLKIGYTPNYSHLVGIMIIKNWV